MKKERLTVKEVNEFNPSLDNPLRVECDDGKFTLDLRCIEIVSPLVGNGFFVINNDGHLSTLHVDSLYHYPSQKQPSTKMVQFYNAVIRDNDGYIYLSNILISKNLMTGDGNRFNVISGDIIKLVPVCELEIPIDFEE